MNTNRANRIAELVNMRNDLQAKVKEIEDEIKKRPELRRDKKLAVQYKMYGGVSVENQTGNKIQVRSE